MSYPLQHLAVASLKQKKAASEEAAKLPWFSSANGRAFDGAAPANPKMSVPSSARADVLLHACISVTVIGMQMLGEIWEEICHPRPNEWVWSCVSIEGIVLLRGCYEDESRSLAFTRRVYHIDN
jgi:hypothetical protein